MTNRISDIKKSTEIKLAEIRSRRKQLITQFKKKLEEEKIQQIKSSILKS